jgi:ABC-type transporter Mla subunit MlaD
MIVRLMGEAQYRVDEGLSGELNELDNEAAAAVEENDEEKLSRLLEQMAALVRERGARLDDAELASSDLMIPPTDLSLDEARELFSGEGLIPDIPT